MPRTPPYAGVDVEPVEKPPTEDDEVADIATPVMHLSRRADTETDISVKKTHLNTGNDVIAGNREEPLLLMPAASNTVDTLFGEVSDSNSGEPVVNRPAASENNVVLAVDKECPPTSAKVSSTDVEEGEITDSDTEQCTTVLPLKVTSVADKENVKSVGQSDTKRNDRSQRNTNCGKQSSHSDREKALKSTSRTTPPRKRTSRDQEQSPNSGIKSRSASDTHHGDRIKFPPRKHAQDDRRDSRVIPDSTGHSSERRNGSDARRTERRQLSPRKNADRSRTNSSKFSFRGRRNSVSRFVRSQRRF